MGRREESDAAEAVVDGGAQACDWRVRRECGDDRAGARRHTRFVRLLCCLTEFDLCVLAEKHITQMLQQRDMVRFWLVHCFILVSRPDPAAFVVCEVSWRGALSPVLLFVTCSLADVVCVH